MFPKLDTLVLHMRMRTGAFEHWHADGWRAAIEVLEHRKRARVPVRELRITGGWYSDTLRAQILLEVEDSFLSEVRSLVDKLRDERIVKQYCKVREGCDCEDTDLESEPCYDE